MKMELPLDALVKGIENTGFPFEYRTTKLLEENNWSVISNRYYIDGETEAAREIDVLAYKVNTAGAIDIVTALVVSCKKSDHSVWAYLTREVNKTDPNIDWQPFHFWTNSKATLYEIKTNEKFNKDYYAAAKNKDKKTVLADLDADIFAFQEMTYLDKGRGGKILDVAKVLNDTSIFSSIMSLMKAQDFELALRQKRFEKNHIKKQTIYQFNLVAACDLPFVKLHFQDGAITPTAIKAIPHVGRYIVNGKDTTSRIAFVTEEHMPAVVAAFNRLHDFNVDYFTKLDKYFYENCVTDKGILGFLEKDFFAYIAPRIKRTYFEKKWWEFDLSAGGSIWYEPEKEAMNIFLTNVDVEHAKIIEKDATLSKVITEGLKAIYHFDGPFEIISF